MTDSKWRTLCVPVLILIYQYSFAQLPEDALRLSSVTPNGTARQQAIGGAMGSLGGEISSMFVNPAGLAMFRTNEVVLSPGFHFSNNEAAFRGTNTTGNFSSNFNLGTSGVVYSSTDEEGSNSVIGIAINQSSTFKNNLRYQGQNDYSSFSEQFAEEFSNSGLGINDAINSGSLSYGTRMALYTYLIDTATINGVQQVISLPEKAGLLNQQNNIYSRGSITEIGFSYSKSFNNKWYVGGMIGIPIVFYTRTQTFTETDATGNTNNDFASMVYNETYSSNGVGANLKAGVIYKPAPNLRFGLAVHSPTGFFLTDKISSSMTTNTENYAHEVSISSAQLDAGSGFAANQIKYDFNSPWKFLISGSYLFGGEMQDVSKQKGFITADIEWVTNRTMKFTSDVDENGNSTVPDGYFDAVNSAIKSIYKNTFNFRVGGEMKFTTLTGRLGFAYSTNPYKQPGITSNQMYISGGAGYRNKGMFIDLTYIEGIARDVNYPYRLADKANTFATIKQFNGTILVTLGFKFL
ncbi:MAG TPA: hypothetical protein VKR53_05400 [Puia sp.]|nr:hypothetical protein [Puia sp.]